MEKYLQEMESLNIVKAIVPARLATEAVNNDVLVELLGQYPDKFIGFAAVEGEDSSNALAAIDKYVINGPCQGVVMEPGCGQETIAVNQEKLYPIYQTCQKKQIPLMVGFGGMLYPSLSQYKPQYLEEVLQRFPDLRICAMHGGWPYAAEMIWLALMYPNFYLMPDLYMCRAPFSAEYAKAANTVIKSKIIYASCYPVISQKESIRYHLDSGLNEAVFDHVFYKNVCRFCGLAMEEM